MNQQSGRQLLENILTGSTLEINSEFRRICRAAGITDINYHSLLRLRCGEHSVSLSAHASIHFSSKQGRAARQFLDRVLGQA